MLLQTHISVSVSLLHLTSVVFVPSNLCVFMNETSHIVLCWFI